MAANLDNITGTNRRAMFYVKTEGTPWHKTGTPLDNVATAAEAIEAAGLNWDVFKHDLTLTGTDVTVDQKALVRSDRPTNVLGYCTDRYEICQNKDAFRFFDSIVGANQAIYHTAGSLGGGERIWLLAKLPATAFVTDNDAVDQFVLLSNSHNGKESIRVKYTPIRVVCQNTLSTALRGGGLEVKIKHNGELNAKFKTAAELMGFVQQEATETIEIYRKMSKVQLTQEKVIGYFESLYPKTGEERSTRSENIHKTLMHYFEYGRGNQASDVRGSVWCAYNAVTEMIDHKGGTATQDKKNASAMFGSMDVKRNQAFEKALQLV